MTISASSQQAEWTINVYHAIWALHLQSSLVHLSRREKKKIAMDCCLSGKSNSETLGTP